MYSCPECKGTSVLVSMWVEANTEKIVDDAAQEPWCNDCEAHVKRLEIVEEKPWAPRTINLGTEDDPLWWSEGLCEDCMNEDGTSTCSCGCLACADCMTEHANEARNEGSCQLGIRPEILASPEAMKRRAAHAKEGAEVTPVTGNYACNQCGYHVPLADEDARLSTGEGDDACECGGTFTQKTRAECRPREQYRDCEAARTAALATYIENTDGLIAHESYTVITDPETGAQWSLCWARMPTFTKAKGGE